MRAVTAIGGLLIILSALSAGCSQATAPEGDSGSAAAVLEESLKNTNWPESIDSVQALDIAEFVPMDNLYAAGGMALTSDGKLWFLDNVTGALLEYDADNIARGTIAVHETNLQSPTVLHAFEDELYASDDVGIHKVSKAGELINSVRSFYGVHDFVFSRQGKVYTNGNSPQPSGPLVYQLDSAGRIEQSLGQETVDKYFAAAGMAREAVLALCRDSLYVIRRYKPLIHAFSLHDQRDEYISQLPFPSRDRLLEFYDSPALVNPKPGHFRFPTFSAAATCVDDVPHILLAFAGRLAVARLLSNSQVQILEHRLEPGVSMLWGRLLVGRDRSGRPRLYALGLNTSDLRWMLAISGPVATKSN